MILEVLAVLLISDVDKELYYLVKHEEQTTGEIQDEETEVLDLEGIARRVSYCESGHRNVRNRQGSSASGYFQFIDSTWSWVTGLNPPAKIHSLETQLEAFYELWDEGRGASHWQPSRYCWQHENPENYHVRP